MKKLTKASKTRTALIGGGILIILLLAFLGFGIYRYSALGRETKRIKEEAVAIQRNLEERIAGLEGELQSMREENRELTEELEREKGKNRTFEEQIEEIADTVGHLDKLSKTDEELLQKYSKVYFLNEHYVPSALSEIDSTHLYNGNKQALIHSKVVPFLSQMLEDAAEDEVTLKVVSSYRSFGTQAALKDSYTVTYGAGTANQFSADQGYSEHQLGTTLDFTTPTEGAPFTNFENTEAYEWLTKNAHNYGFVLSYPKNNTYYQFEPWHWRFVGEDLAEELHERGVYFYDLDQREINAYLAEIFD